MAKHAAQRHLSLISDHEVVSPGALEATTLARAIPSGRLVELSGSHAVGRTTSAVDILRASQAAGETSAWVQTRDGGLYPPDLLEAGIDLSALLVVHLPPRAGVAGRLRAAELLLRSAAFGLLVLDLDDERPSGPPAAWQGRLLGLARQHDSRIILLTRSSEQAASLGPLIGLRFEPRRRRCRRGQFSLSPRLLKNKSGAPIALEASEHRGPWGLV